MKGMKRLLYGVIAITLIGTAVNAQTASSTTKAPTKLTTADETKTPETLLVAIYAAISGPAGERDWDHFRTLFPPEARFTRTREKPGSSVEIQAMSVDDFIKVATDYFKNEAFYENGVVNKMQRYGRLVQAFSSYESRHAPGEKPFARGINSVQMMSDGTRWWVVSIAWDEDRPGNPMPKAFAAK